jgi:predicted RNA-binding Zn ribbon-like protein
MARKPPRYDVPKAAPPPLRVVQELINTEDLEHGRDFLSDAGSLGEWLAARGLPGAATDDDLAATRRLRRALRALLAANCGLAPDPTAVGELNDFARASGLGLRFGLDGSARLEPEAPGVTGAHGSILAIVHGAMADGSWRRLKTCRNCSWSFYDYSKNRSATWCSMQLCGNRLKTRAYRARHASRAS